MNVEVSTCYRFVPLADAALPDLQADLERFASEHGVRGLCLIGTEGVNLTVSGSDLSGFRTFLRARLGVELTFKDSVADRHPFNVFKVKIKDEIVTLGRPDLAPATAHDHHLSPAEWDAAVRDPSTVVIDTRNDYEIEIGKFRRARDFGTKEFREFPEAVAKSGIPKDQKILMYCTGGIRCEKAILAMREQGYEHVYQLEGGILNYLREYPESEFEGECFVFDYRVAVDQHLQPTARYLLCPHCGQPADRPLSCAQCATDAVLCRHCIARGLDTCSKNCAHHRTIGSGSRNPQI